MRTERLVAMTSMLFIIPGVVLGAGPVARWTGRTCRTAADRVHWRVSSSPDRQERIIGNPVGWLNVPAAAVSTMVVLGATEENMSKYPCLVTGFSPLGKLGGLKVIAAHRDMHFRRLGEIRTGDEIRVELTGSRGVIYRVLEMEVLDPVTARKRLNEKKYEDWLVLMTCYPFRYIGPAPERFIVWAKPEESGV